MGYFRDLRDYLAVLEQRDKLVRVKRPTLRETEITPLVRLQYRGLPESLRKGFLFENVIDSKGRKYDMRVATGIYASSMEMYGLGLMCEPTREAIQARWSKALLNPIPTKTIASGPTQDVVLQGADLLKDGGGIESLPLPVEEPGYSGHIRTSTYVITEDPETGTQNMGTYSGFVLGKAELRLGIGRGQHGWIHRDLWKKRGQPMPAAVVVGGPPILFYVASAKIPYGVDELDVAGGFGGGPVEMVKCKTIDLNVPAHAEIIIEGLVSTDYLIPGNAFGEFNGYMATDAGMDPVLDITSITHRRDPIHVHIMSEFPPSESSKVRLISMENLFYKFLKYDCKFQAVLDVALNEMSQGQWVVIKIKKTDPSQPWQILYAVSSYDTHHGKFFIVVDEDIDPRDFESVVWALGWRVQPQKDMKFTDHRIASLDPSVVRPETPAEIKRFPEGSASSAVLIDATMKWPYPPTSLPQKEYMEKAVGIWKELGLPELSLKQPWYGYSLGYWPKVYQEDAEMILRGDVFKVGERLKERGRPDSDTNRSTGQM